MHIVFTKEFTVTKDIFQYLHDQVHWHLSECDVWYNPTLIKTHAIFRALFSMFGAGCLPVMSHKSNLKTHMQIDSNKFRSLIVIHS